MEQRTWDIFRMGHTNCYIKQIALFNSILFWIQKGQRRDRDAFDIEIGTPPPRTVGDRYVVCERIHIM